MRLVLGFLAASLVGPTDTDAPNIAYEIKILEMAGLEWRSTFYPELQPVTRRGVATVWTAAGSMVAKLAARADKVVGAPRMVAFSEASATVYSTKTRSVVAEMARNADGPVNHASYVAFQPRVENATEGYSVKVSGRKLDQGVLARVSIDDRQITAVHTVKLTEAVECKDSACQDKGCDRINVDVHVPEYAQSQVAGEWLIPNDGVLLVSLGAHTVADAKGKAVVRERLAVIAAQTVAMKGPALTAVMPGLTMRANWTPVAPAAALPSIPMPAPSVPSRSLPMGVTAGGVPGELPPLPEDLMPPTALPHSSEPCATPQTKPAAPPVGDPIPTETPEPRRDPASRKAGFVEEPACCEEEGTCCAAATSADARPAPVKAAAARTAPAKATTFTFRIPLKADLIIEVHASARPLPPASAPLPPVIGVTH